MPTKRKKTMTPKQLKANKENAKKSTGPKTPEGKARSSLNATTHALTARCIVFDDDESIDVYLDNFAELIDEWHPIGHTESSLVQRIAACNWRLNRAYRFEARCVRNARKLARREAESFDAEYRDPPVPDPASIILPDSDDLEEVDLVHRADVDRMQLCLSGSIPQFDAACADTRLDIDTDVDSADADLFVNCMSGADVTASVNCR